MLRSLLCASAFITLAAPSAQAYSESECRAIVRDFSLMLRNEMEHFLDGAERTSPHEMRPRLESEHTREDNGVFYYLMGVAQSVDLEAFERMGDYDRLRNTVYIQGQINTRCRNGTIERRSTNF